MTFCLPEEVILTVQFSFSWKTLFWQSTFALTAVDALDVPWPVQNFEQKPIENGLLAAGALDHGVRRYSQTRQWARYACPFLKKMWFIYDKYLFQSLGWLRSKTIQSVQSERNNYITILEVKRCSFVPHRSTIHTGPTAPNDRRNSISETALYVDHGSAWNDPKWVHNLKGKSRVFRGSAWCEGSRLVLKVKTNKWKTRSQRLGSFHLYPVFLVRALGMERKRVMSAPPDVRPIAY